MNKHIRHTLALLAISTASAFGQGALNPPGAPATSMKSLLEIFNSIVGVGMQATGIQNSIGALKDDPRTRITTAPFTITQPGSYYLAGNFSITSGDAITVAASDVSLDLSGFALSSTHASGNGSGVLISGSQQNIEIKNGGIRGLAIKSGSGVTGGGFIHGVFCGADAHNITVLGIRVFGVTGNGISVPFGDFGNSVIERCNVSICGGRALVATVVRSSTATDIVGDAITAISVSDSVGASIAATGSNNGIVCTDVINSQGSAIAGRGIDCQNATNCSGSSNSSYGIIAVNATNCHGTSISGRGIFASSSVTNSWGQTISGAAGIDCDGTVSFSRAFRSSGGVAIDAAVAIGCTVLGGTVVSPQKHLGTP